MMTKKLLLAVKALVTGAALYWLITSIDWSRSLRVLGRVRWPVLAAVLILNALILAVVARRWQVIAAANGYPLTFAESLEGCYVGSFFSTFLPTGKGGDFVRSFLMSSRKSYSSGGLLGTVMVERFLGLVVNLILLAVFGVFWMSQLSVLKSAVLTAGGLALGFAALVFLTLPLFRLLDRGLRRIPSARLQRFAGDFLRVLEGTIRRPRLLWSLMGLSALNQLLHGTVALLLGLAIPGFRAPWYAFFIVTLLVFVVVLLPSVGGHGVRESGLVAFFGWFGVDVESAGLFALLNLFLVIGNAAIGLLIFLFWKKSRTLALS